MHMKVHLVMTLLAPDLSDIRRAITIGEAYAEEYYTLFNSIKSKLYKLN